MNQYFNSWYSALIDVEASVSNTVEAIVQLLDPLQRQSVALQDLIIALTSLSAFLGPVPDFGGALQGVEKIASATKDFAEVLDSALKQNSSIGNVLYPTGGDALSQN